MPSVVRAYQCHLVPALTKAQPEPQQANRLCNMVKLVTVFWLQTVHGSMYNALLILNKSWQMYCCALLSQVACCNRHCMHAPAVNTLVCWISEDHKPTNSRLHIRNTGT